MPDVKKVIKKVRNIPRRSDHRDISDDWLALAKANVAEQELWERDKKIKREENFRKMQYGLELKKEADQAERERQAEIAEQRLRNLRKARRALKRKRSKET